MSKYVRVDEGSGASGGQLLRHVDDPKRWLVRAFVGRDAGGRKKYGSRVVRGNKRDARAALAELLQEKYRGTLVPRSARTIAELASEWLAHKSRDVSPRTLRGYRDALESYVLPVLGSRRLTSVSLRDIDYVYGAMLAGSLPAPEDGQGGWNGKPLSPRTVRLTHAALSQALGQAVKWGWIPFNPASEASIPAKRPKERRALNADERARLVDACGSSFFGPLYRVLVDTGLRPGEACGLRWSDVDFDQSRLAVRRAVTRGTTGPVIAEPKTSSSRRTVPLMTGLREMLREHRRYQSSSGLHDSGFVITNTDGQMLAPFNHSKRDLHRVLQRAEIDGAQTVTLYSLRHTFATLHLQAGTPLKVVSELMGHASIQQTANTYQHVSSQMSEDWMLRLEQALPSSGRGLGGPSEEPSPTQH